MSTSAATLSAAGYARIAECLHAISGLTLGRDKGYLLETRLAPLLVRHRLRDLDHLAERLDRSPSGSAIAQEVNEAMTINETLFFRDSRPFEHVTNAALPELLRGRPQGQKLRIWSAASSTGQEAYSLAMIVAESALCRGHSVEIVGTDISASAVDRARAGRFTTFETQRGLPPALRQAYFDATPGSDGSWTVGATLRSFVRFECFNLMSDLTRLGTFDIIFCRNVLIYFDLETKRSLLERMSHRMRPNGFLYLGGGETVHGITDAFTRRLDEVCCRPSAAPPRDRATPSPLAVPAR